MFGLIQLRCFVALSEELHFGRAATRLNMTQPPLSQQIQELEHVVGTPLVERSSRFLRITAAGKAFLIDARAILRAVEEAMVTARQVMTEHAGKNAFRVLVDKLRERLSAAGATHPDSVGSGRSEPILS